MSGYEEDVTPMVLLSQHDYEKLKKNSDLLISKKTDSKSCCECKKVENKSTSKEKEEDDISEDLSNKQGHGEVLQGEVLNSFDNKAPLQLPAEYIQPNNEYQAIELNQSAISLVPNLRKDKAKELLEELRKKKTISWCPRNEVTVKDKHIVGSDVRKLIEKVFNGVRRSDNIGEIEFIKYLVEGGLGHYIESVGPDWYYIGKP